MKPPRSVDEYLDWCNSQLGFDFRQDASQIRYDTNVQIALLTATNHDFFRHLPSEYAKWETEYQKQTGSQLFMANPDLKLVAKPYWSAINKSFRKNIIWNNRFPDAPVEDWVTPRNLHRAFNDVIRGYLVCRFIDGPSFLAKKLNGHAKSLGLKSRVYSQERDIGYYAYHFYVSMEVEFIGNEFNKEINEIEVEVQITTQLQEVLRALTHQHYAASRLSDDKTSKWKWEYQSERFKLGYISHTLHLLESIIVELRDADPNNLPGKSS